MYEDYFGLERPPFKITPDTSLFYEGGKRGDILSALVYAIHRGEGIVKVVGEVGSGKTMLCRMLQLRLPKTVEIVYIANPSVSAEDILFVIAHELNFKVSKQESKHEVMRLLQDYLVQRHMEDKQVVLFVEEAQSMPIETLEEIRLLSNLETNQNKLLLIVLFGQPELDDNLTRQEIRQLRERITHNFELDPLTQSEIHSYLNFRIRQVGYTGPELIDHQVAKKIEQHSLGLLRRINIIADKILLAAFAEGTHNLNGSHVKAAVNDSPFDQQPERQPRNLWWWAAPAVAVVVVGIVAFQFRADWMPSYAAVSPVMAGDAEGDSTMLAEDQQDPADFDESMSDTVKVLALDSDSSMKDDEGTQQLSSDQDALPAVSASVRELVAMADPTAQAESEMAEVQVSDADSSVTGIDDGRVKASDQPLPDEQPEQIAEQSSEAAQVAVIEVKTDSESTPIMESQGIAIEVAQSLSSSNPANGNDFSTIVDSGEWLDAKLDQSREWLTQAGRDKVSIQVLMRRKSAVENLVAYLRKEWPLGLEQTFIFEVNLEDATIYRVYFGEFDTLTAGRNELKLLPESVKRNGPHLNSIYRMRNALL